MRGAKDRDLQNRVHVTSAGWLAVQPVLRLFYRELPAIT